LELAAQVARDATAIRDVAELLDTAVHLISDRFDFYHAGIFLVEGEYAVLCAASSPGGQQMLAHGHKLKVGEVGIVGHVALMGEPRIALDVGTEAVFFDNPHLPGTRSEIALPLKVRGEVIGVLDVQSLESAAFSDEDVGILLTLADQIAVAIERTRAENKLKETLADLARSNREIEQFAFVASHDLQEPLRSVSLFVQLLAQHYEGKLDADADEYIGYAVDGAARMKRMINDLLTYSMVGTQGRPFRMIDCCALLDQALAHLAPAIEQSGATVTRDPLPAVMADAEQLVQVFQHLIDNAVKFCREGEPPQVHVSARRTEESWVISVQDNGVGVEPEYHERIFRIFQRVHEREYPSIDLVICRRIIERHGGKIWVESEPGQGATFLFTLPVEKEQQDG
jgi:signal transduction histidine kinase